METPRRYIPRISDTRLTTLLKTFGGVEITGPKWCGKTWTATHHANSADSLMDPATREAARIDPSLILQGVAPHLIDEWQEVPQVWDAVRSSIDESGNVKGQYLLTGSTQPKNPDLIRHSGAGRISRIRMYPMTISESVPDAGGISFAGLFDGVFSPIRTHTSIDEIARWVCRGGWPSIIDLDDDLALETPAQYLTSVIDVEIPQQGKNPTTAHNILRALALNTAQPVKNTTIIRDLGENDTISRPTLNSYLDLFRELFILEELESWAPQLRSKNVLTRPKSYFVDPSLPASLLGATPNRLLRDTQTLGNLFETLVLRDLRVFLSVLPGAGNSIGYYRDDKNAEIDFIVQLADGRWAAVETKLSDLVVTDEAALKLKKTSEKITANLASRVQPPTFRAFIVGRGNFAYQREDGIYVIPIRLLEA